MAAAKPVRYKFGDYELDVSSSALYRKRERIPLQSKPMSLLAALLARRGQVVTRNELARELWPDTHVLVDQGLNAAIRKLRVALQDDAKAPKYIETLGSRGYRVIPEVVVTRWAEGVTVAPHGTRIAVLPLEQINGDASHLAAGISAELTVRLGKMTELSVIAAGSSATSYTSDRSMRALADELSAEYIVTGSVRRVKDVLRITTMLVRSSDLRCMWAETIDADANELPKVQDDIAYHVANCLQQAHYTPEETPATTFAVYEQYLRGLHFVNMRTPGGFRKGIEYFERAIKQDPNYPNPFGALADTYNAMAAHGLIVPREGYQRAREFASRALQLSPNLLEAIVPLAYAELAHDYDFDRPARALQRAIRLNPSFAPAHKMLALLHLATGDVNSALTSALRALELDPLSLPMGSICSMLYMYARRYDEAIEQGLKTLELGADFPVGYASLGWAYTVAGRHEEALRCYEAALTYSDRVAPMHAHLAYGLACAGRHHEAREQIKTALEAASGGVTTSYALALASFEVGDPEQAAKFLRKGLEDREQWVMFFDNDPRADRLKTLPEAKRIFDAFASRRPDQKDPR